MLAASAWDIVTSLVDSLAWPVIVLTALVMLFPSLRSLISDVSKVRHGNTEVHFDTKDSHDLDKQTEPKSSNLLETNPSLILIGKIYGYLNYQGGTSNFWIFGIGTGDSINITVYPFREISNNSCYFSLSGRPDPGNDNTPSGTTIGYLLQEPLSPYSSDNPYRTTLTIPNYANLTTPPCEGKITNIEIDSEGPVAFIIEVIGQDIQ